MTLAADADLRVGSRVWTESRERLRVLTVAGVVTGVVIAGIGGRLAMLLLRVTSPDQVVGVTSDDGFEIGRFTLSGSYSLLMLGASVGIIGAAAYRAVKPWLLGPSWFRRLTTGLGAAAVVGSMLLHADGVDFNVLEPTWLAIALFVGLPFVFGVAIGPVVDRVAAPESWTKHGRLRWAIPLALVVCFPLSAFTLVIAVPVVIIWVTINLSAVSGAAAVAIRGAWLAVATLGLVALVNDIDALV